MAYNFPISYQPAQFYYPPPYMPQQASTQSAPQQTPPTQSGITWVQGEAGAKSYLVAPNTTVQLWDSEEPIIYLKSADASGMPSMKILEYTVREPSVASEVVIEPKEEYVSRNDLNGLERQINALRSDVDRMMNSGNRKKGENK